MSEKLLTLLVQREQITHIDTHDQTPTTYILPDLTFTVGGLLQKWIFVSREDSRLRTKFPHFRVWRRANQQFTAVEGTYTMDLTPAKSRYLNVYEYTLEPPVQVEPGDLIGWEQTRDSDIRYLPLILNNTGYNIHRVTSSITGSDIQISRLLDYRVNPLVGVQLLRKNLMHSHTQYFLNFLPIQKMCQSLWQQVQQSYLPLQHLPWHHQRTQRTSSNYSQPYWAQGSWESSFCWGWLSCSSSSCGHFGGTGRKERSEQLLKLQSWISIIHSMDMNVSEECPL